MQQSYKPGSVFSAGAENSCHFSKRPTPRQKRVAFIMPVYMAFHPAGQTAVTVARYTGGLLPHLLTLIRHGRTVFFFFVTLPSRIAVFQQCGTLCCPDFPLLRLRRNSDRTNCCKILKNRTKLTIFADLKHIHEQTH